MQNPSREEVSAILTQIADQDCKMVIAFGQPVPDVLEFCIDEGFVEAFDDVKEHVTTFVIQQDGLDMIGR